MFKCQTPCEWLAIWSKFDFCVKKGENRLILLTPILKNLILLRKLIWALLL